MKLFFTRRRGFVLLLDLVLFVAAYVAAHLIRLDTLGATARSATWAHFQSTVYVVVGVKVLVFVWGRTYRGLLQYASIEDVLLIVRNSALASLTSLVLLFLQDYRLFSRSIFVIDWMLTVGFVSASRLVWRLFREGGLGLSFGSSDRKPVLVVGAGRAGLALAKDLLAKHQAEVVGFVDDDPDKQDSTLLGRPILGPIASLPQILRTHAIAQVIVAIPSATPRDIHRIAQLAKGVPDFRAIPSLEAILSGRAPIGQTLQIPAESFLRRQAVDLADAELALFLAGKTILVTGAGGSIGGELCRQIARQEDPGVRKLVLLDCAETPLYEIDRTIREVMGNRAHAVLASIRDGDRMSRVIREERPDVILHAAALKHVPLSEANVLECVATNTLATCRLAELARATEVGQFVLVSTDKAVAPSSVMGLTKRASEVWLKRLAATPSRTRFAAVRFGNVLGSNGSVLPLFHEQIARGGPLTVTDKDATRFFMTTAEACGLILHATRIATSGEVYVLDMGQPVSILELAQNLIRLYGYEPGRDIEIKVVGLRPGEKLHESLFDESECAELSAHPRILTVRPGGGAPAADFLPGLADAVARADVSEVMRVLGQVVPTYRPVASNQVRVIA